MTVVGVAAAKGSPGVTTAVLALASAWPRGRGVTVVDLDVAGGDVAGWLDLPAAPNVSTLAADCRHGLDTATLEANVQSVPGGAVQVLAGARTPEEAAVAVELLRRAGAEALLGVMAQSGDVLIDLGRLGTAGLLAPVLGCLDELVVVLRPTWSQVHHVAARLAAWKAMTPVRILLIGERPYGAAEVADALGVEVVGVLADDATSAGAFNGTRARARGLERSRLWRSAAALSDRLTAGASDVSDFTVDGIGAAS